MAMAVFNEVGGSGFNVLANTTGRSALLVGAGANAELSDRVALFGSFDIQLTKRQSEYAGSGGLQLTW